MNIKYVGPYSDYSGYGEANRNAIRALVASGINVTTEQKSYVKEKADFGKSHDEIKILEEKPLDYQVKIIHITPDGYMQHLEPGKYHIGHLFWETDKLPKEWVWNANLMDEIWTGDEYHADVFRRSGVKAEVRVIPQAIETDMGEAKPFIVNNRPDFLFYSIFQWIERKNPRGLLEAYWQEFKGENVGLMLKTYRLDFSRNEFAKIFKDVQDWKGELGMGGYPPVFLYDKLMNRDDIFRFHASGDCFVLPHRGEGWGIPQVEASIMGRPVISTNLGGMHEWMDDTNMKLLKKYKMRSLFNMDWVPWYTKDQNWAEPNITELRKAMRWAYEHRDEAKEMGNKAQKRVKEVFSYKTVGNLMKKRLEEIAKGGLLYELHV